MARQELASGFVVGASTPNYVGPVATNGLNGVQVDLLVISVGTSPTTNTVSAIVEASSDLENWTATSVIATVASFPGFVTAKTSGTASQCAQAYVRVKLTPDAGSACVTSGVSLFQYST